MVTMSVSEYQNTMIELCMEEVTKIMPVDGNLTHRDIDKVAYKVARIWGLKQLLLLENAEERERQQKIVKKILRKEATKKNISNEDKYVESNLKIATLPIQYQSGDSSEEETNPTQKKVKRRNTTVKPIEPVHKSKNSIKKEAKKASKAKKAKK